MDIKISRFARKFENSVSNGKNPVTVTDYPNFFQEAASPPPPPRGGARRRRGRSRAHNTPRERVIYTVRFL